MEHHSFVVETADEELVLAGLIVEATGKLALLRATDFFGGSLLIIVLGWFHEHFQVLVEDARGHLDVSECLGCAFEVVHGSLTKAGLHAS